MKKEMSTGEAITHLMSLNAPWGKRSNNEWIKTSDRLPTGDCDLLFVVYTPAWIDVSGELAEANIEIPENTIVVSGYYIEMLKGKRGAYRSWSWEDSFSGNAFHNEVCKEECGSISYITHWMPFPEPPLQEVRL